MCSWLACMSGEAAPSRPGTLCQGRDDAIYCYFCLGSRLCPRSVFCVLRRRSLRGSAAFEGIKRYRSGRG